jgi:hypothetical protein
MKKVFGNAWWIEPTKSGKFALIEGEINLGDRSVQDMTDKQMRESNIEIFDTELEANNERTSRLLNSL